MATFDEVGKLTVARIQMRRDTAANFQSQNPRLYPGEIAFETDTGQEKIGNGATGTPYNDLPYRLTGPKGDPGTNGIDGTDGADGADGAPGIQGLPGVNAVENNTAVAAYITTDGSSAVKTALDANYAKVVQVVSTGVNQLTQINQALAAGTAFGFRKVVRLRGAFTITGPIIVASNTEVDATEATITLAAGSNTNLLQNAAVAATSTRDTQISVRGGVWDRGANGGTGTGLHSLLFRRVDGLTISDLMVKSTGGKYAINAGGVTAFHVDQIQFATASDGVHINGPASHGHISNISGTTGDDSVAFTGNDYDAYADVSGDITNVTITNINTTSTGANLVKVLAGSKGSTPFLVSDIEVTHVRGTHKLYAVWLGDDNGYPATDNGNHGSIRVHDVETRTSGSGMALVFANMNNGADSLTIGNVVIPADQAQIKQGVLLGIGASGVVNTLVIDGIRAEDGWANTSNPRLVSLVSAAGATFTNVEIRNPAINGMASGRLLELAGTNITNLRIVNPQLTSANAATQWVSVSSSSNITRAVVSGGRITDGKTVIFATTSIDAVFDGGIVVQGSGGMSLVDASATAAVRLNNALVATSSIVYAETSATYIDLHIGDGSDASKAAAIIGNYATMGSKIPIRITRSQRSSQWTKLPQGWDSGWRAAKASASSTPANVLIMGDSIATGQGSTDWVNKAWAGVLRTMLTNNLSAGNYADFWPAATFGIVSLSAQAGTLPYSLGSGGVVKEAGFGRLYTATATAGTVTTFTIPATATAFEIVYSDYAAGTWAYAVDGGTATTVTCTGDSNIRHSTIKKTARTNVTTGSTHPLVISAPSGSNVLNLIGVNVYYGTAGLGMARNTYPGMRGVDLTTYSGPGYGSDGVDSFPDDKIKLWQGSDGASITTGFGYPTAPILAVLAWGVNDAVLGAPVKNFEFSLKRQIAALRRGNPNCSIIILANCLPDGTTSADTNPGGRAYDWAAYKRIMSTIADTYGCAYVDIDSKWGQIPYTLGFQASGNVHPTDAGHADIAVLLGSIL